MSLIADNLKVLQQLALNNKEGKIDEIKFLNGSNSLTLDSVPTETYSINLPPGKGSNGQTLIYDGNDQMTWGSIATSDTPTMSILQVSSNTTLTNNDSGAVVIMADGPYTITLPAITADNITFTFVNPVNTHTDVIDIITTGSDEILIQGITDPSTISSDVNGPSFIRLTSNNTDKEWIMISRLEGFDV